MASLTHLGSVSCDWPRGAFTRGSCSQTLQTFFTPSDANTDFRSTLRFEKGALPGASRFGHQDVAVGRSMGCRGPNTGSHARAQRRAAARPAQQPERQTDTTNPVQPPLIQNVCSNRGDMNQTVGNDLVWPSRFEFIARPPVGSAKHQALLEGDVSAVSCRRMPILEPV